MPKVPVTSGKKGEKLRDKYERGNELMAEARRLSRHFGISIRAEYSWRRNEFTGGFIVPGHWLRSL